MSNQKIALFKKNRIKAIRIAFYLILVTPIPVLIFGETKVGILFSLLAGIFFLVKWFRLMIEIDSFICPDCGKKFIKRKMFINIFTSKCVHCGLGKDIDESGCL